MKEFDGAPNAESVLAVLALPNEKAAAAGAAAAGAGAPKDGVDILDPPNSDPVLAEFAADVDAAGTLKEGTDAAGVPKAEPVENADAPELPPNANVDVAGAAPVAAGAAPQAGAAPVCCTIVNQS